MADDLSQLDNIIESDILEALGQEMPNNLSSKTVEEDLIQNVPDEYILSEDEMPKVDTALVEDVDDETEQIEAGDQSNTLVESVTLNSSSSGDLLAALSQLLNNKTIEITIKIKD